MEHSIRHLDKVKFFKVMFFLKFPSHETISSDIFSSFACPFSRRGFH